MTQTSACKKCGKMFDPSPFQLECDECGIALAREMMKDFDPVEHWAEKAKKLLEEKNILTKENEHLREELLRRGKMMNKLREQVNAG